MKEWTIMVYMAGDNNLSEDMVTGLKGMMSVAGKGNFNLIACYDSAYPPIPVKIYDFSKDNPTSASAKPGKVLKLKDFAVKKDINTKMPDLRTDFIKLEKFIPWVLGKYRTEKYALILAGHSDGVIGRTLLRDENPSFVFDLKKLRVTLENNLPVDKDGNKKKIDLLGFDSCLMSMLEVGYEMRNVAKVMVASEGNIPSSGWAYEEILKDLVKNSGLSEKDFALSIVKRYISFNSDYAVGGRSVNTSACNLENVRPLAKSINQFARRLLRILELPTETGGKITKEIALSNTILREQFINLILLSHYESQTFLHEQAVDILDFIRNLLTQSRKKLEEEYLIYGETPKSRTKRFFNNKLEAIYKDYKAIRESVLDYVITEDKSGAEYQFSTGVSIFFPWSELALDLLYAKYKRFDFNISQKAWLKFIEKYTNITLRVGETMQLKLGLKRDIAPLDLNPKFSEVSFSYLDFVHREHGGREHGGREHGGRGDIEAFYKYFSQVRNYSTDIDFDNSKK